MPQSQGVSIDLRFLVSGEGSWIDGGLSCPQSHPDTATPIPFGAGGVLRSAPTGLHVSSFVRRPDEAIVPLSFRDDGVQAEGDMVARDRD